MPEEMERVWKVLCNAPFLSHEERSWLKKAPRDKWEAAVTKGAKTKLKEMRVGFLKKIGVCCFSERNDNLLMWAHYGGGHRGFCLEFRTNTELCKKLQKVKYVEEMPRIPIAELLEETKRGGDIALRALLCTKSTAWRYEKEWRGLYEEAGTLWPYRPTTLKAVYFGSDVDKETLGVVCLILQGQNPVYIQK